MNVFVAIMYTDHEDSTILGVTRKLNNAIALFPSKYRRFKQRIVPYLGGKGKWYCEYGSGDGGAVEEHELK